MGALQVAGPSEVAPLSFPPAGESRAESPQPLSLPPHPHTMHSRPWLSAKPH